MSRSPSTSAVAAPRARLTPEQSLVVVRARLQAYADRSVFRGFSTQPPRSGTHRFKFSWLFPRPLTLQYTPTTGTFRFIGLLPAVGGRSPLYRALQAFVDDCASPRLPPHRRVDRCRAKIRCVSTRGALTVELAATRNHHEYGVNRIVNLVNWIFHYLQRYQPEYMWRHFDAPQE